MNMTHPDILNTEAHGMPDPDPIMTKCRTCERMVEESHIFYCAQCGRAICGCCLYTNDTFMETFCSEELAVYPGAEIVRIPTDCYDQWCLERMCHWQDKYFDLAARREAP